MIFEDETTQALEAANVQTYAPVMRELRRARSGQRTRRIRKTIADVCTWQQGDNVITFSLQ